MKPVQQTQPKQEVSDLGSLNLYGNQQQQNNNNNLLSGFSGLNLYGNTPQPAQNQGMNLLNNGGGFNITMQTGQQSQSQPQPQIQPQPQNTGFNFLGTTTPQVKTDNNFLGFGNMNSSSNTSQTVQGYENSQLQVMFNCSK